MSGASLWLIAPSDDNPFNKSLKDLIESTIPSDFPQAPKLKFTPHVTLTSEIDPTKTYATASSPQDWLDNISLPSSFQKEKEEVIVELEELESDEAFFRKITLRARKDANLLRLVSTCREHGVGVSAKEADAWAESDAYQPHLSLFYGDLPLKEIRKKIPLIELQLGFEFGSLFDCCGGTLAMGAKLALVDTSQDVKDWKILAERTCPWAMWKMARGLL